MSRLPLKHLLLSFLIVLFIGIMFSIAYRGLVSREHHKPPPGPSSSSPDNKPPLQQPSPSSPAPAEAPPVTDPSPVVSIPLFPWPPPAASAAQVVPNGILRRNLPNGLFEDVDNVLSSALETNGYVEKSYYAVPKGFALVTRLEQIMLDGKSKQPPARWSAEPIPLRTFSLEAYLRALFTVDPGRYRIIVFIITNVPFSQVDRKVTRSEAVTWLRAGLNILPSSISKRSYTPDVVCTALVYEFECTGIGSQAAHLLLPSHLDANSHLVESGLWKALSSSSRVRPR